jgi:type I restriction-modification system DNA methylase subunit
MHLEAATALISQIFGSRFNESLFENFVANLLNTVDRSKTFGNRSGNIIPQAFRGQISTYRRPFVYTDPRGERVDVLIVRLHNRTSLERARSMQRNFIAHYISKLDHDETVDAVLVAFYHEDAADWRFSLVRLEYLFGEEGAAQKLTPARRYSFLVGPTEPTHTAERQLRPFLVQDNINPTIDDLARAFQIEVVSKRFFEEYTTLFHNLLDELERVLAHSPILAADFDRAEIKLPDFAKKLLGQIVFLYFVQKKGWLGVEIGADWGSGPKGFLRRLFAQENGVAYANFFNDVLEPIFYDALAESREGNRFRLGGYTCLIPFLNGGLFEPMGGYDWRKTALLLPNALFSNRKNEADDSGTGILDVFDRYNFTVWEEEPLDKEVAVDPEMLGKVFENLLEVRDRKSKGAFYTPREIVHYMCQESLINYLDTAVNEEAEARVSREHIVVLVRQGALALQQDAAKEAGLQAGEHVLPHTVREHAQALDDALASIKLCDPAVGSGAFPVGMLHEIVQARLALDTQLRRGVSAYSLKRHAIQESIYSVDIDPGAVEIAKLRLWLSLVVDEESYANIQPLPNLDYKIVCGNSLLEMERNLLSLNFYDKLNELKPKFFSATHYQDKAKLKVQIDQLFELLTGDRNAFDITVYFQEVFAGKGGFDVVIGNPPYLRIQGIRKDNPELANKYKETYKSATGSFDLYVLFVEKGIDLLGTQGQLNFIMPDAWTNAGFGKGLRHAIAKGRYARKLISFGAHQVFNASTYTSLLWLTKKPNEHVSYYQFSRDLLTGRDLESALYGLDEDDFNQVEINHLSSAVWVLTDQIIGRVLERMVEQRRRLSEVFLSIFQGVATSKDSVYFLADCHHHGDLIEGYSKELDKRVFVEAGLMKPLLKGDQVHRYIPLKSDSYVLFPYQLLAANGRDSGKVMSPDYVQSHFLQGWKYLLECEEAVKGREGGRLAKDKDWYRYIYPKNITLFQKEKLLSPDISLGGNFAYDSGGKFYMTTTVYGYIKHPHVTESYNFWLALLNSKLLWFYLQNTGKVLANGYFRYKPAYLESFPVPTEVPAGQITVFDTLVDYITSIRQQVNVKALAHARDAVMVSYFEQLIDALIYELYFSDELHQHNRYIMRLLQAERLPELKSIEGDRLREIRRLFEQLFERNHPLRQAIYFLDSLETVRIVEGKRI